MQSVNKTDVVIVGAGAAGLMCAIEAGRRGRSVTLIDHARRAGEKIRISGGGRCNFTNLHTAPENFLSQQPRFCISALSRYTPGHFIELVHKHRIAFHEKKLGQLFCDGTSQQIVSMLLHEAESARVKLMLNTRVEAIEAGYRVASSAGGFESETVVIASGGLSIPKMGATGFGYEVARQFGLEIVQPRAALVAFTLADTELRTWGSLAGVSLPCVVSCRKTSFTENMLFTHRGLSGPAMLQISSYWRPGDAIHVDMAPGVDSGEVLKDMKRASPRQSVGGALASLLPKRLADVLQTDEARIGELSDKRLEQVGKAVNHWMVTPSGTEGYRTAEVTAGGVDTRELSSKTMEARRASGLFFIGEVVDVTGHLGGFNFQWAWASGHAAGQFC